MLRLALSLFRSLPHLFTTILHEDGLQGLYRYLTTTIYRRKVWISDIVVNRDVINVTYPENRDNKMSIERESGMKRLFFNSADNDDIISL